MDTTEEVVYLTSTSYSGSAPGSAGSAPSSAKGFFSLSNTQLRASLLTVIPKMVPQNVLKALESKWGFLKINVSFHKSEASDSFELFKLKVASW